MSKKKDICKFVILFVLASNVTGTTLVLHSWTFEVLEEHKEPHIQSVGGVKLM